MIYKKNKLTWVTYHYEERGGGGGHTNCIQLRKSNLNIEKNYNKK